jgi:hypothetical protein
MKSRVEIGCGRGRAANTEASHPGDKTNFDFLDAPLIPMPQAAQSLLLQWGPRGGADSAACLVISIIPF